mmetsp:Transcript_40428/g.122129  ORF Transcript_40428/g.122129 Transcript_40428/m.122129 type:complete len:246 (+) Transcript_40428:2723-3460(+)
MSSTVTGSPYSSESSDAILAANCEWPPKSKKFSSKSSERGLRFKAFAQAARTMARTPPSSSSPAASDPMVEASSAAFSAAACPSARRASRSASARSDLRSTLPLPPLVAVSPGIGRKYVGIIHRGIFFTPSCLTRLTTASKSSPSSTRTKHSKLSTTAGDSYTGTMAFMATPSTSWMVASTTGMPTLKPRIFTVKSMRPRTSKTGGSPTSRPQSPDLYHLPGHMSFMSKEKPSTKRSDVTEGWPK